MGYFAYQAFTNSSLIQSESTYEQQLREEGIDADFVGGPITTGEAVKNLNTGIQIKSNNFFDTFMEKIRIWRIQVNAYIDTQL